MTAPAIEGKASSLIIIFKGLRLPLTSRLDITSSGGSKEVINAFDVAMKYGGSFATGSLRGNSLLVSYHEPSVASGSGYTQPAHIEIKAVLQETSPVLPTKRRLTEIDAGTEDFQGLPIVQKDGGKVKFDEP